MQRRNEFPKLAVLLLMMPGVWAAPPAAAQSNAEVAVSDAQLQVLFEQAEKSFVASGPAERAARRAELVQARDALAASLQQTARGGWLHELLGLKRLDALLEQQPPDLAALDRVFHDLHRSPWDVEPSLRESVRDAVLEYTRTVRGGLPDARASQALAVATMREGHEALAVRPTREGWSKLQRGFAVLSRDGQARELTAAIQQRYSHPNHVVRIARWYLEHAVHTEITESRRLEEMAPGAPIAGQLDAQGVVQVRLVPNPRVADLRVFLNGKFTAGFAASANRLAVEACSNGTFDGSQLFTLSATGVSEQPPGMSVSLHSQLQSLQLTQARPAARRLLTPLATRIAGKRLASEDPRIAAKTEVLMKDRLQTEARGVVLQINRILTNLLWEPLRGIDVRTRREYATTDTELRAISTHTAPWQLAAPQPPPWSARLDGAIQVQLHESALNDLATGLEGATLTEPSWYEFVGSMLGFVGEGADMAPWNHVPGALLLAPSDPLHIQFDGDELALTLVLRGFEENGQRHEPGPLRLLVGYRLEPAAGRLRLVRTQLTSAGDQGVAGPPALQALAERMFPPAATLGRLQMADYVAGTQLGVGRIQFVHGWFLMELIPGTDRPAAEAGTP